MDGSLGSLRKKRVQTLSVICAAALASGGASGAPTPGVELPKQGAIAAADLALCVTIYGIWFDGRVTNQQMLDLMVEAGLVAITATGLVYAGVKVTEGLLAEALNAAGPAGWGISALITGSVTGAVGVAFWALCESPPVWLAPGLA